MHEESKGGWTGGHVRDVQDTVRGNTATEIPEEKEWGEVTFGDMMTENFPKLVKAIKSHTKEQYVIKWTTYKEEYLQQQKTNIV